MTPATTGGKRGGNLEFDRRFRGVGRIRGSSGVPKPKPGRPTPKEFIRRDGLLTKLFKTSQLELLRAFKAGRVTIGQLVEHDRHGRGGETLVMVEARKPLWATVDELMPRMGRSEGSRLRYATSLKALQRVGATVLPATARVQDLARVHWPQLHAAWPNSAADWNRMRAAVSRFLTLVTGDKYSAFRRQVMNDETFPIAPEPEGRTPDLTPTQFVALLARLDDPVRAAVMLLVLTGMRIGEYLVLDRTRLQPGNCRIKIPRVSGVKTGERIQVVERKEWGWIVAAVPFAGLPVPATRVRISKDRRYGRIMRAWKRALAAEKLEDETLDTNVVLHDLRHCAGQWASNAGISTGAISDLLGQKDPRMARRYERMREAARASRAVARTLRRVRAG